jgi:CheY-like chemotaxis protein
LAKILVVDDVDDVADSLAELLRLCGYDVTVAYSAAEAISTIESCLPDVVLVDINMPVVDGFQLARQIRRRWGARIRLVAHTAYPRSSVAAQAGEAGFTSLVSKSARPLELALTVGGRARAAELRATALRDRRRSQRFGSASRRATDLRSRFAA